MELSNGPATVAFEEFSLPFIGRWTRLVSTTNWDKGLIIHQWRQALMHADAPATEYSDEVWSRRVGGVSPQHVGRLRRVHDRFGEIRDQFPGLYWSHYQAALDWDDAEMWLEGATQNSWSVAQMRKQRWEAMGMPVDEQPSEQDGVDSELDEDAEAGDDADQLPPESASHTWDDDEPVSPAGPDFGDEDESSAGTLAAHDPQANLQENPVDPARPFEGLPDLPEDLQEAFEAFKICIVKYKSDEWQEVPLGNVLHTLDALKQFAVSS